MQRLGFSHGLFGVKVLLLIALFNVWYLFAKVALAMSKEEADEKERCVKNDKIKLEMALKESAAVAADVLAKKSPNHNDPKAVDPWNENASTSAEKSFDPFSFGTGKSKHSETNGFDDNAWSAGGFNSPSSAMSSTSVQSSANPWNAPTHSSEIFLPPPQNNNPKKANPWGAQTANEGKGQSWIETSHTSSIPSMTASIVDPWNSPSGVEGSFLPSTGSRPAASETFASTSSFDPLQDFDSLHISSAVSQNPTQISIQSNDFFSGSVLTPMRIESEPDFAPTDGSANHNPDSCNVTQKAGAFLGDNVSLVNVDNLVTKNKTATYYHTLSTDTTGQIGVSRNPFNQKGPSPSLNQMKNASQAAFQGPTQSTQPASGTGMRNPTPMTLPPMGYAMANPVHMQPGYMMPSTMNSNPFGQPNAAIPTYPQQNPSLF